ncbi:hypothetical protein CFREI_07195 [Corynebacterium freiburgense]|nr:hypothetical protein CFREI_07195 [Corynebacterium freiburgense]
MLIGILMLVITGLCEAIDMALTLSAGCGGKLLNNSV